MKKMFATTMMFVGTQVSVGHADILITSREGSHVVGEAEEMPGGDKGTSIQLWSRADRMARIGENRRMIGRLDRGESYMINDATKTCTVIKHKKHEISESNSVFVQTAETRQIGAWQAVGYELTVAMGGGDSYNVAIWVSDEVTLGLEDYRTYSEGVASQAMSWMIDALKLGGYPVRQEITMGPMTSWSEIVSVEDKSAPSGIYDKPDGYSGCD